MTFLLLFATLAAAAPPAVHQLVITEKFFPEILAIYSSRHDIVEIMVPLNNLNYPEPPTYDKKENLDYIFFVEADFKKDDTKDYEGSYVYKNGTAKKVLENGQTATYSKGFNIYFGASDGIYKYNCNDDSVSKYGTVNDSVIKMAVDLMNIRVYYLTSDYVLYKFDKDEVTSSKVEAVKDAREIVFNLEGKLFFYDGSKEIYVYNGNNVVKVEGLPATKNNVALVSIAMMNEVHAVIDGSLYEIRGTGTSEYQNVKLEVQPTAFAPDIVAIEYFAYNKKIYEYNLLKLNEKLSIEELEEFFAEKEDEIKTIARATPLKL